mmetsp:Transcript_3532/g.9884  ORF Transcript_3532/g.9884 Transcript_3532/m.9884 type:complete len:219 (-) Transcript_3532:602-1258(-)
MIVELSAAPAAVEPFDECLSPRSVDVVAELLSAWPVAVELSVGAELCAASVLVELSATLSVCRTCTGPAVWASIASTQAAKLRDASLCGRPAAAEPAAPSATAPSGLGLIVTSVVVVARSSAASCPTSAEDVVASASAAVASWSSVVLVDASSAAVSSLVTWSAALAFARDGQGIPQVAAPYLWKCAWKSEKGESLVRPGYRSGCSTMAFVWARTTAR